MPASLPSKARRMSAWLCGIYLQFCIVGRHVVPCNHSGPERQPIGDQIEGVLSLRGRLLDNLPERLYFG